MSSRDNVFLENRHSLENVYNVFSENTPLKKVSIFLIFNINTSFWGRVAWAGGRGRPGAAWGRLAGGRGRLFNTFAPPPDAREEKSINWLAENDGRVVKY